VILKLPPVPRGLAVLCALETSTGNLLCTSSGLHNIKPFGQRIALKATFTMIYTIKDFACDRREQPRRRESVDGALENTCQMPRAARLCLPG
jgi:hypothetical protein